MMNGLQLDSIAPDFEANSPSGEFYFYNWLGNSSCVIYTHANGFEPKNATSSMRSQISTKLTLPNLKIIGLCSGINIIHRNPTFYQYIFDANNKVATKFKMPLGNFRSIYLIGADRRILWEYSGRYENLKYEFTSRGNYFNEMLKLFGEKLMFPR